MRAAGHMSRLLTWLLLGLMVCAGMALAQQHHGDTASLASLLRVGEPIVTADQRPVARCEG